MGRDWLRGDSEHLLGCSPNALLPRVLPKPVLVLKVIGWKVGLEFYHDMVGGATQRTPKLPQLLLGIRLEGLHVAWGPRGAANFIGIAIGPVSAFHAVHVKAAILVVGLL